MSDPKPNCIEMMGGKVRAWTRSVPFDDKAMAQVENVASLPFTLPIAVMPDVHWGLGATVGSVIPTRGAIIPAAVGVDIGCGMVAAKTNITANDLPDSLRSVRTDIEAAVPHGRTDHGGRNDQGAWDELPAETSLEWRTLGLRYNAITEKHPKAKAFNRARHLGTLGTGNHFIEVCLDESFDVWVMLHSGSRGLGNRIGTYFIGLAKKEMERWFIQLPDKDLSYLVEGTEYFDDYVEAVGFAQDFAATNRRLMLTNVLDALRRTFPHLEVTDEAVNCHHNYVTRENHFGHNMWITRKGAVNASKGVLGIIPGSMGERSYIVEGLGSKLAYDSCSHGAGRVMSRTEANRTITLDDHAKATAGVECRKDEGVLDESPAAYKSIDAVMAAQSDLVKVRHTLKQVVCVKG